MKKTELVEAIKNEIRNITSESSEEKENLYYIVDIEDGEIFEKGTPEELKDWWWDELANKSKDVGGFSYIKASEYNSLYEASEDGWKEMKPKTKICPNCGNPKAEWRYEAYWCRLCKNEFDL